MTINKEKELLLDHKELTELIDYNTNTGIATYKKNNKYNTKIKIGDIAGSTPDKNGYMNIQINGIMYRLHRVFWFYVTGEWPIDMLDHKDTIRHHNWFDNLRESNNSLNQQNQQKSMSNNISGAKIPGIGYRKDSKKYRVRLTINGKLITFGNFDTLAEAELCCLENRRRYMSGNLL